MIKELVLIPRLLYSILFVGFAVSATGLTSPILGAVMLINIFIFSFLWQYLILHFTLKQVVIRKWRPVTLIVWMVVATLVGGWSLSELKNFDYLQSDDIDVARSFARQSVVYIIACEMFIAGACARRAFKNYNEL